jgi:hypothetical protein
MNVLNRDGHPVDPVPFLVTSGLAVTFLFSTGPLFGISYGLSVTASLVVAAALSTASVAACYYRLVWTAVPKSVTVPASYRFERLLYLAVALGLVLLALSLPLLF